MTGQPTLRQRECGKAVKVDQKCLDILLSTWKTTSSSFLSEERISSDFFCSEIRSGYTTMSFSEAMVSAILNSGISPGNCCRIFSFKAVIPTFLGVKMARLTKKARDQSPGSSGEFCRNQVTLVCGAKNHISGEAHHGRSTVDSLPSPIRKKIISELLELISRLADPCLSVICCSTLFSSRRQRVLLGASIEEVIASLLRCSALGQWWGSGM